MCFDLLCDKDTPQSQNDSTDVKAYSCIAGTKSASKYSRDKK